MADEWTDQEDWDGYEVNRQGDTVFLILSRVDSDTVFALTLTPEDATTVGLALAQAGQEPKEERL